MGVVPGGLVWAEATEPAWLAERTRRGLARAGLVGTVVTGRAALDAALRSAEGPVWLVRAGAWPASATFEPPRPSATARPLLALGAVVGDGEAAASWRRASDLDRGALPAALSVWLEPPLAAALARRREEDLVAALQAVRDGCHARVVRVGALDVAHDRRLRVAEVVTSLKQGGAERVALDLAAGLQGAGVSAWLAVLGEPGHPAFARPAHVALLEWEREGGGRPRVDRLAAALVEAGIDAAHAHLLSAEDLRRLGGDGVPVVATVHNERPGWPAGTAELRAGDLRLLVACSRAVEADVAAAALGLPCRTVWNGIEFGRSGASAADGDWRARLGFSESDFVLLALANPRPQKRLERLPGVLAALRTALRLRGAPREARLVVAGAPFARSQQAVAAQRELEQAVERLSLREHVRLVGAVTDVAPLLRASDVLVSASAHEGLSLAQLEALACDRPVVTTDVGGAREVAARVPGVALVPRDAAAEDFLPPLLALAGSTERRALSRAASAQFSLARMAADYARLLRSAARSGASRARTGLVLVANNFSTGGAQSSARRLLLELGRRGVRVRAAVIQEQPAHPTPGRRRLEAEGVPVLAVPPPADLEPAAAVARIAEWIDADPPEAVVLWNAIAQHKVLLADTLFDVPVFDVSPGEMYFESLERYFANPRPGLPYDTPAQYGSRLAGVIVKYSAEAARAARLGAPVHVIPNGVERHEWRPPVHGDARVVIGTLARLDPRKHLDRLLRALRLAAPRLPPHVLRIAGGREPGAPGHEGELRRLADGLCVELVGEVAPEVFLRGLDVFALVAEPEGCPNASLEAMARGIPVVATRAGGMEEQVEDGVNGRLVGREDEHSLAEALIELCSDVELRRRFGSAGQARARERFSLESMADAYVRVLLTRAGS